MSSIQTFIDFRDKVVLDHAALSLPISGKSHAELPYPSNHKEAVTQACNLLGFTDIDTQCISNAWDATFRRTGQWNVNDWPSNTQDFGINSPTGSNAFPTCPNRLGLYAVLPDASWIYRMAQAGVPTLQLRYKSDDLKKIRREVKEAIKAVSGTQSLLFINDHWREAIDLGAYGVHLGQEDLEDAHLELIRKSGIRLGLSTHGYAEMVRASLEKPSYIALGAIFPTTLKRMKTAPQGTARLKVYADLMKSYPLVAIGGIDKLKLDEVLSSKVGSVAVVRAIVEAQDPEAVAIEYQKRINEVF